MPAENPYFDVVDRLKIKEQRYALFCSLSARPGTRPSEQRGEKVSAQKLEVLIWGLSHDNPVVRWQCLELLDTHPDQRAVPAILGLLDDPVPRVRWHALHALECDVCKGGESLLDDPILAKIRELAEQDENKRVRAYAQRIADSQGPGT
jgi:HEAT repeat protein